MSSESAAFGTSFLGQRKQEFPNGQVGTMEEKILSDQTANLPYPPLTAHSTNP